MATRPQVNPAALIRAALWFGVLAFGAPDLPTRANWTIQLWAIGEGAALFGGVIFLLSGDARWHGLGLLSMLTVFVLVPLPRQS